MSHPQICDTYFFDNEITGSCSLIITTFFHKIGQLMDSSRLSFIGSVKRSRARERTTGVPIPLMGVRIPIGVFIPPIGVRRPAPPFAPLFLLFDKLE